MKLKKILKLRPEFKYKGITTVDWFEAIQTSEKFAIRSGFFDKDFNSPYRCEITAICKDSKKECIKEFNRWWKELHSESPKPQRDFNE